VYNSANTQYSRVSEFSQKEQGRELAGAGGKEPKFPKREFGVKSPRSIQPPRFLGFIENSVAQKYS